MLSAGNPYVLPSVLVAAGAYLALTVLTDASVLIRIGVLVFVAGVVPIALNRVLGGSTDDLSAELPDQPTDDPTDDPDDGSHAESVDEPTG